jgi:GNAT superfamily N-acetyltransferase
MVTVRPLRSEDIEQAAVLTAQGFGGADYEGTRRLTELAYTHCPFMPLELGFCAEVAGKIVAKWQGLDLTVRLGEARFRTLGGHALVVDPAYRGKGLPELILSSVADQVRAMGRELLLGFAQRGSAYAVMGAATVCADYEWTVDGLSLPVARDDRFRELRDEDVPLVIELYNRAAAQRGLGLVRSVEQWPWLTRRPPRVLVCEQGYLGLRESSDALEVRELGFLEPGFARLALEKLGSLARERGVRRVFGHVPIDHPLVEHSRGYGADVRVTYPKRAGAMAGLIRPDLFLAALKPELEARLGRSALADCSLSLELVIDGAAHSLLVRGEGARVLSSRLALSGGELAQLAFGYRSVRSLPLEARLDPALLALLEAVFPPAEPFFWHTDRF